MLFQKFLQSIYASRFTDFSWQIIPAPGASVAKCPCSITNTTVFRHFQQCLFDSAKWACEFLVCYQIIYDGPRLFFALYVITMIL